MEKLRNAGMVERRNDGKSTKILIRGKVKIRSIALKAGGQKKIEKKGDMKKWDIDLIYSPSFLKIFLYQPTASRIIWQFVIC